EILAGVTFFLGLGAFRSLDLFARVPFLLAIGLSVIAAIALVSFVRLLRCREFELQWSTLRRAGRFTRAGIAAFVVLALFLGFSAYAFVLRFHARAGEAALDRWQKDPRDLAAASAARSHLETAISLSLVMDDKLENLLAVYWQRAGDPEQARRHLE